jgi:hypothetical protein
MKYVKLPVIVLILLLPFAIQAQLRITDTIIATFLFKGSYALQFPGGDNTAYFGYNSTIGAGITYKTNKNWLHSLNANFIFGDQVTNRNELLQMITTSTGEIIDGDGTFTSLTLFQRGYHIHFQTGKIFNLFAPNPNSGIFIQGGAGFLSHHIRIESQFGTAPQIEGDYGKGYDKMRGGFALAAEAGYLLMSNSRVLNFSLSLEYIHAWTASMRDYNFESMGPDNNNYSDNYFGIRLSWMIPGYKRAPQAYYYY